MKRAAIALLLCCLTLPAALAFAQQPQPQPAPPLRPAPGLQAQRPNPVGGPPARIQVLPNPQDGAAPGVVMGRQAPDPIERPAPAGKGTALLFWVFAAMAVGGSLLTITRRNAITAVMCLVGTFIAISAVYVMLLAHFMAAIQVLVYAGAIMVLFVFVVMILNKEEEEIWGRHWLGKSLAVGALVYSVVRLSSVLWTVKDGVAEAPWKAGELAAYGSTKAVGRELFTTYLFPFEAISIALIIAIVGAVVLAHPEHPTETHEHGQGHDGTPQKGKSQEAH